MERVPPADVRLALYVEMSNVPPLTLRSPVSVLVPVNVFVPPLLSVRLVKSTPGMDCEPEPLKSKVVVLAVALVAAVPVIVRFPLIDTVPVLAVFVPSFEKVRLLYAIAGTDCAPAALKSTVLPVMV